MFQQSLFKNWPLSSITVILILMVALFAGNVLGIRKYTGTAVTTFNANRAYQNGYWGDAGILYHEALTVLPEEYKLKFNLANTYYMQGRYIEAIVLYKELVTHQNNGFEAKVWNNMGNCYYDQGYFAQSYQAYKTALLLDDKDNEIRQNFLFMTAFIQRFQNSRQTNKKSEEKKPGNSKTSDNQNDNNDGQRSDDDHSAGLYHVSDKEMENLLKLSKEHERVPAGSKSTKHISKATGPDY